MIDHLPNPSICVEQQLLSETAFESPESINFKETLPKMLGQVNKEDLKNLVDGSFTKTPALQLQERRSTDGLSSQSVLSRSMNCGLSNPQTIGAYIPYNASEEEVRIHEFLNKMNVYTVDI